MLKYSQSSGVMSRDGAKLWVGYAGNGEGLNNPALQHVKGHGPLPQGFYTVDYIKSGGKTGPASYHLQPDAENQMFNRGDFFVHGDNSAANHSASDGCIIKSPASERAKIRVGDRLQVTA